MEVYYLVPGDLATDLLDQLVPDSLAQDDVQDRLMRLGKTDDGGGVEEKEQVLHQLRAAPELFLSLTKHFSEKTKILVSMQTGFKLNNQKKMENESKS